MKKRIVKGMWFGTLYANPFNPKIKDDRMTMITVLAIRRVAALKYLDSQKETIPPEDYVDIKAEARRRQGKSVCQN